MLFVASIPIWGWFDVFFSLMVLAGVCGEVNWKELPRNIKERKFKSIAELLLILGIAGELVCLGFSLIESAKLYEKAEIARLEAERIKKLVIWRTITPSDSITSELKKAPGSVDIIYEAGDAESTWVAMQLETIFGNANWQISVEIKPPPVNNLFFGLHIPDNPANPDGVLFVRNIFSKFGVSFMANDTPPFGDTGFVAGGGAKVTESTIRIIVARKIPPIPEEADK